MRQVVKRFCLIFTVKVALGIRTKPALFLLVRRRVARASRRTLVASPHDSLSVSSAICHVKSNAFYFND